MQTGKGDNRTPVHRMERRYVPDKPKECKHCYFWKGRRKGCGQEECYYLLPNETGESEAMQGSALTSENSGYSEIGDCRGCPYGRHSPCIGYCLKKIMREMREKKQAAGKEENGIAGRSK